MNLQQVRNEWIRPALARLARYAPAMNSLAAEQQLLGTFVLESAGGQYLRQWPAGPALGVMQVESATHLDCWLNFVDGRPTLSAILLSMVPPDYRQNGGLARSPVHDDALVACPMYCNAIARVKYWRAPAPLPLPGDWAGMEAYHKAHYNTAGGKTRPGQFLAAVRDARLIELYDTGERYV